MLLLEAGGRDVSPLVHIPAGFGMLMGTRANWIFDTVPQRSMHGRRMFLPQGKPLGGSTAVNAMLYVRAIAATTTAGATWATRAADGAGWPPPTCRRVGNAIFVDAGRRVGRQCLDTDR